MTKDIDYKKEIDLLKDKIISAHCILFDYDGHYDTKTKTGDIEKLAQLIDEAVNILKLN
jgi:hypothetical protein